MGITENEQKKEYLNRYGKLCRQIKRIEQQIRELRRDKICPAIQYDDMPKGSNQSDLSDYAARLDELEREYIKQKKEKLAICDEIKGKIESLDNENEKDVLIYRYIGLWKWEDICSKMGYSWRQIHYIHSRALKNINIA